MFANKPVFWALALLAMAFAARSGMISSRTAAFLLLTIPLAYIVGCNRTAMRHGCKKTA